jgi:carbon monoxide dehydrogenase subunit G
MGDYEGTTTVDVPRDDLFEYLSRIQNLSRYLARMTKVCAQVGNEANIEVQTRTGDVGVRDDEPERTVRGKAWLHVDADARRLEWGAEGPHDYHGELEVSSDVEDETTTRVVVRLYTLHDDAESIEEGLAETLENIERLSPSDLV